MRFDDLKLMPLLLQNVQAAGYETPTPIQQATIPLVLAGKDVLGCAQTGTGKTAAFALPIIQQLAKKPTRFGQSRAIRALILTPTRELALQIGESFDAYGKYLKLRIEQDNIQIAEVNCHLRRRKSAGAGECPPPRCGCGDCLPRPPVGLDESGLCAFG